MGTRFEAKHCISELGPQELYRGIVYKALCLWSTLLFIPANPQDENNSRFILHFDNSYSCIFLCGLALETALPNRRLWVQTPVRHPRWLVVVKEFLFLRIFNFFIGQREAKIDISPSKFVTRFDLAQIANGYRHTTIGELAPL
jgi:hypothetical protein